MPLYKPLCRVPNCGRANYAKGYCRSHYERAKRRQAARLAKAAARDVHGRPAASGGQS